MKIEKIILWGLLPFLVSCSDSELELHESTSLSAEAVLSLPSNPNQRTSSGILQTYDFVGNINSNLYASYDDLGLVNPSLPTLIDTILHLGTNNSDFASLSSAPYQFDEFALLQQILTPSGSTLKDAIEGAIIDTSLQIGFEGFIYRIRYQCAEEDNYASVCDSIAAYESQILLDTSLTSSDQNVVLTTTSILRHSVERIRKRPKKNTDPDWDLMITTMGATVVGSKRSLQDAIILSLLTEISLSK